MANNFKVEKVIFNYGPYNDLEQDLIKVLEKNKMAYYSCIKELNIDDNKLKIESCNPLLCLIWYNRYGTDKMDIYKKNDLQNPKYLFHGSPKILEVVEQRQARDSNHNVENEDFAVFLTSSFIIASAYAFKDKIKKHSEGLDWNFDIRYDINNDKTCIRMDNVNVSDDIQGYIYVFLFDENYEHQCRSIQYKCHKSLKPIDVVKIRFGDFKKYYSINAEVKKK